MAITVRDIYKAFPSFTDSDMRKLMGSQDYDDNSVVVYSKIANYGGSMAMDLSVFAAKKEGEAFVGSLSEKKRKTVAKAAGMGADNQQTGQSNNLAQVPKLPMDVSVFSVRQPSRG